MRAIAIAAAGLMAFSLSVLAQGGTAGADVAAQNATQNSSAVQMFVDRAAMINMYEIDAGHVAEQKLSNQD